MPDETPTRRRSDRWQQWTAVAFMWITGLSGLAFIVGWIRRVWSLTSSA